MSGVRELLKPTYLKFIPTCEPEKEKLHCTDDNPFEYDIECGVDWCYKCWHEGVFGTHLFEVVSGELG